MALATGDSSVRNVEAVVDSGAEDSVTLPNLFPGAAAPSPMSREGRRYRAANGSPIPNLVRRLAHCVAPMGGRAGAHSRRPR